MGSLGCFRQRWSTGDVTGFKWNLGVGQKGQASRDLSARLYLGVRHVRLQVTRVCSTFTFCREWIVGQEVDKRTKQRLLPSFMHATYYMLDLLAICM